MTRTAFMRTDFDVSHVQPTLPLMDNRDAVQIAAAVERIRILAEGLTADEAQRLNQPGFDARLRAECKRLKVNRLSEVAPAVILGSRVVSKGGRRRQLCGMCVGWTVDEAAILRKYLADPLRDPARLGVLCAFLEREAASDQPGGGRCDARWREFGPVVRHGE